MRARVIKPEFWSDEDLAKLSPYARLFFQGLWAVADRRGILADRPVRLRAQIFPYEPEIDPEALLSELAVAKVHGNGAFITRYEVDGVKVIKVNTFHRNQRPHPKEPASSLPDLTTESRDLSRRAVERNGEPEKAGTKTPVPSVPSVPSDSLSGIAPGCARGPSTPATDPPPRKSPWYSEPGLREADERELLRLAGEIAAETDRDGAEVLAAWAHYDGATRTKTNPASMTDDRLKATLLAARKERAQIRAAKERAASDAQTVTERTTARTRSPEQVAEFARGAKFFRRAIEGDGDGAQEHGGQAGGDPDGRAGGGVAAGADPVAVRGESDARAP